MGGDVVNLRRERKKRGRVAAGQAADANRVAFGLSKAERRLLDAERESAARHLDGHALGPPDPADGGPPPRP